MLKRTALLILLCFVSVCIQAQAGWNNSSYVHRSGKQILDGQNNPIHLNGVNLGGWLLWEGWIWGGGYTQQKTIYNNIKTILGTAGADAFVDSVNKTFITKKDIQEISQQCFNVVRIPFNSSLLEDDYTPYVYKPAGWAVLDSVLSWCETYNVYAVLDMHSAPGGQSNAFTADPDLFINLWNGAINQKRTKLMWKAIAARYKNRGIIAAYDLLNEPNTSDSGLVAMYNDITDSIRTVDTHHMISLEGNNFASDFTGFTTIHDPNTSFHFHFYTWFYGNNIAPHLSPFTAFSNSINAPIWCGEWGENNYAPLDTTLRLLNSSPYGVSGASFWTWKKMANASSYPAFNGADTTAAWNKAIKWICNTNAPQPTVAEMQTGIHDFIQKIKWANCHFDNTLAGILNNCTGPTGVIEQAPTAALKLYPNPASDLLTLEFETGAQTSAVEITDAQGSLISSQAFKNTGKAVINVQGFIKGLYLVKATSGQGPVHYGKFVKQ